MSLFLLSRKVQFMLSWLYLLPCSCADMFSEAQELLDIDLKCSDLSRQPCEYQELLTAPAGPRVRFQASGAVLSDYSLPCLVPWNSAHSVLCREMMRFQNQFNSAFYLLWNWLWVTSLYDPSFQEPKFLLTFSKTIGCNCRWYIFWYWQCCSRYCS